MKKINLAIVVIVLVGDIHAQAVHPSNNFPCTEPYIYTNPAFPGAYSIPREIDGNCIEFYEPTILGNLITEGRTDVVATKSIHFKENFHVGFAGAPLVPTGNPGEDPQPAQLHAFTRSNDFDVFWFEPNSTVGVVPRYEKMELGVRLPTSIRDKIKRYVNDSATGARINPFNPDEISVEAQINYLGGSGVPPGLVLNKTLYGFYYRDFHRDIDADLDINDDSWVLDTTSFDFRIRHALPLEGDYLLTFKVVLPGQTLTAVPVHVECVSSSNPGFVYVGDAERYFKLGEETFFPVGNNIPMIPCSPGNYTCPSLEAYSNIPARPKQYEWMETRLQNFKDNGGNMFRFIMNPWHIDIEFEKINNYSNRMTNAWEMDRLLDKIKELDLHMQLNLQIHYVFENPGYYEFWNWDWGANSRIAVDPDSLAGTPILDVGYCYNTDLSLSDPILFFTDEDAITNYKRKLRYIISRWGYSTNISMMELLSEIDNCGQEVHWKVVAKNPEDIVGDEPAFKLVVDNSIPVIRPYWRPDATGVTNAANIANWEATMFDYIKNDLKHTEHLLGPSYTMGTGGTAKGERDNGGWLGPDQYHDFTYGETSVDYMSYNHYTPHIDRFKNLKKDDSLKQCTFQKPLILSEMGPADAYNCDNGVEWLRDAWISPFTGLAAKGNHWDFYWNQAGYWNYFEMIKTFLDGYNFADEDWTPVYDIRNDNKSEVYALVSENKNRAVGVIINRTINFYTMNTSIVGVDTPYCWRPEAAMAMGIVPQGSTPTNIDAGGQVLYTDAGTNELKIDMEAGNYTIDYYSGVDISEYPDLYYRGSDAETVVLGKINLEHKSLNPPGYSVPSFIQVFQAYKTGSTPKSVIAYTSTNTLDSSRLRTQALSILPNPALNEVVISTDQLFNNQFLRIFSYAGELVFSQQMNSASVNVKTNLLANGVYSVIVTSDTGVATKKLVIQK